MNEEECPLGLTGLFASAVQHTVTEPFIADVDIIDEKITIVNPSASVKDMTGYKVSDYHGKHVYHFPDGYMIPAVSKVVLFCCPGTRPHVDDYQVNHLLWMNRDGTMRRKEVLNNDGDSAILLNAADVSVALCTHLGEMKLLNEPVHRGIADDEVTGVIPFWRILLLPLLLLFLMSYFFEAPHDTFHTKLESVVTRLHATEESLTAAQNRAAHAQNSYEKLHSDFLGLQEELSGRAGGLTCTGASEEEVAALFAEFREVEAAERESLRLEVESLTDRLAQQQQQLDGAATDSSLSTQMEEKLLSLHGEVDTLHEEVITTVRAYEDLGEDLDVLKAAHLRMGEQMRQDMLEVENELAEDLSEEIATMPPLEELRAQAEEMVRAISSDELETTFSARVEALKDEFQQAREAFLAASRDQQSSSSSLGVTEEALELLLTEALTVELREHRHEDRLALEAAVEKAVNAQPAATCTAPLSPVTPEADTEAALARRDFALRGAGGKVVYGLTSATYSPNQEQERRRSDYESPPGALSSDPSRKSLRSSVSGLLTEALGHAEGLLGFDASLGRKGFFETGVGGPNEAISQDVSLGSCWAMQGHKGHITIQLKDPVHVAAFSIDHVSRYEATDITTAPASFAVFGYSSEADASSPKLLLEGRYSVDSNRTTQTFALDKATHDTYQFIRLEVNSNHGNADYTCLYRFRVHGEA